jgi:hypothetical protein
MSEVPEPERIISAQFPTAGHQADVRNTACRSGRIKGHSPDRHDYLEEKKAALERWGTWFDQETISKVIPLREPATAEAVAA